MDGSENFQALTRTMEFNADAAMKFSGGVRAFIMSASTIADLLDDFYLVLGEKFVNARLYMGGRRAGLRTAAALVANFKLDPSDKRAIENFFSDFYASIGWARLNFDLNYATHTGHILATNSFLAQGALAKFTVQGVATAQKIAGPQARCTMLGGYVAGLVSNLFGADVDVRETKCIATNHPACKFEVLAERLHVI